MSDTQYLAAKTIDEAVDAHAKANGSARFLAGGTDLLVQIKSGIRLKTKVKLQLGHENEQLNWEWNRKIKIAKWNFEGA